MTAAAIVAIVTPAMAAAPFLPFHPAQQAEDFAQRHNLAVHMTVFILANDFGLGRCHVMRRGGQGGHQAQSGRGGDDECFDGQFSSLLGLVFGNGMDYGLWGLKRF